MYRVYIAPESTRHTATRQGGDSLIQKVYLLQQEASTYSQLADEYATTEALYSRGAHES